MTSPINNEEKETDILDSRALRRIIRICGTLAAVALILYISKFFDRGLSTHPADWGVFGDYVGGVLNPLISIITLFVTIRIAIRINQIDKRKHHEEINGQVKPVLSIEDKYFFSADISRIGLTAMADFYSYNEPQEPITNFSYLHQEPFYIQLSNIGLGLAIKAEAIFEIDFSMVKESIELNEADYKIELEHQNKDSTANIDSGLIKFKIENQSGSMVFSSHERKWIGVISHTKDYTKLIIPDNIIDAFRFYNIRRVVHGNDKDFPVINLTVNYKNIHETQLSVKYKIGFLHIKDYPNFSVYKLISEEQEVSIIESNKEIL